MDPKILIAAPIRNRAAQLYNYIESLCHLDYPKELLSFYFLVNDSTDATLSILQKFKENLESFYRSIVIEELNLNAVPDARTSIRRKVIYGNLAFLRNKILDRFLATDNEYLFSIDSDIVVHPDCLKKLLEADKDLISAEVANDFGKGHIGNTMRFISDPKHPENGQYLHYKLREQPEIYEVDLTGAVFLVKRDIIKLSNAKYFNDPLGEDKKFCEIIKKAGYKLFSRKNLAYHDMKKLKGEN